MSCAYCAPKSSTSTGCGPRAPVVSGSSGDSWFRSIGGLSLGIRSPILSWRGASLLSPPSPPSRHPHALGPLVRLALGLDRRRDDQLGLLELADVRVAGRGHRHVEPPEQVQRSVVLVGGADQDLLQRGGL